MRFITVFITSLLFITGLSTSILAESKNDIDPLVELQAASDYFHNLGIGELDSDIKIVFDPSGQYDRDDIEKWNIPKSVYPWIGHYYYRDGGIFSFKVFGEVIARNDAKTGGMESTIVVPVLPLPGGIMTSETVLERYSVRYKGEATEDGNKCNIVRMEAVDPQNEFFSSIEYYIDNKYKVIRKVDFVYDLGIWAGSGEGKFYYKKKKGEMMPSVGHGTVYFRKPYSKLLTIW
ncbi:hypothetical protein KKB99_01850, partial [bacterium]|nr:hypothetical protein [bacterium]MBU1024731.1 hypothetical protein [bacterium]